MPPDDLAHIESIVRKAGEIALSFFGRVEREEKGSSSNLVTVADREVERFLKSEIRKCFPGDGFIGEEFGVEIGSSDRIWTIDPIDGTADFANDLPTWAVALGLIENREEVTAGFVFAPALRRFYSGFSGKAFLNGNALIPRKPEFHPGYFMALNSSSPLNYSIKLNLRLFTAPSALNPCMAMDGSVIGAFSLPAYIWDITAPSVIVKNAGGVMEYLGGGSFTIANLIENHKMPDALLTGSREFIEYARPRIRRLAQPE